MTCLLRIITHRRKIHPRNHATSIPRPHVGFKVCGLSFSTACIVDRNQHILGEGAAGLGPADETRGRADWGVNTIGNH
jgi:hypothetical protein